MLDSLFDDVKRMNKRQFIYQVLSFGMIVSSALMIWKGLMVVTGSESPIVVVLSGSMEPAFHRGDLLFLTNYPEEPVRVGEIVVFKVEGRDIPIVHRVLKLHEKNNGTVKFLTKGDNNSVDDRGLYAQGQLWLTKKDVVGRARGFLPYVGSVCLCFVVGGQVGSGGKMMRNCASRRCCVIGSVLAALVAGALVAVLVLQPWAGPDHRRFPRAAVAANGHECASIGREILEKNGSAVDAAIATLLCEGIGCAQCMGLGGGFLATVYDASTGQVRVINARERAPAAAHENMFANASSTVGGLAIAVPGELRGYGALHQQYGRLPWREVVRPTADLCRKGHQVTPYMGRVLGSYSDRIKAEPSMRELYVNPATGEVWNEGDLIVEPTLARTLDIIAEEGPEAIHNGSLTAALVQDIQAFGGIITEDDLRNYKVEWQDPIEVPLSEDYTLYSVPLPGSGSVLAFILNMLREWIGAGTDAPIGSPLYWHRTIEAFKYAYAKRTGLGDPNRNNLPYNIVELERNLSNANWAASHRALVNDTKTYSDWQHYGALFEGADDHGTAHVVVVAPDGSVVSATSTINYIWGCQRRSQSLGIMLNNEMDDFAIPHRQSAYGMPPSPANMLAPGLQPLSSMVPSIVVSKNGNVDLVLGAAGGTKITTQVALMTRHVILEGNSMPDVIAWPRVHHQLVPMEVEHEAAFSPEIVKSLQDKGHATTALGATAGFAAMVAAARDSSGYLIPMTDHRRIGSIDGF